MRRSLLLVATVLLCATGPLPALSRADFDRIVDFSVTLKSLSLAAQRGEPLPAGKLVVVTGTVADVNILQPSREAFKVRVELISGEWIGLEEVRSYTCYLDFSGSEFFSMFPARPPQSPPPGVVVANARVVAVGSVVQVTTDHQGNKLALLQGLHIRTVE
jgi:hypothetical protein